MDKNNFDTHLEPRVAKLETGLEILTRDVSSLAQITREQGTSIERQIRELAIGISQAAAPKKTDWGTLIAAIMLIMAIGSAVFWPLNQTSQNAKTAVEVLTSEYHNHTTLELHPVGKALLNRLEEQMKLHSDYDAKEFLALDAKLQKEFGLVTDTLRQKQIEIEKELTMINDKMCQRVTAIEARMKFQDESDLRELREWRNKASGLSSPEATVPLMLREDKK